MQFIAGTVLFSLLVSGLLSNQTQRESDASMALRQRVERYHRYFSQKRYDLMWRMSSKALRERNDNDEKEYIKQARQYGLRTVRTQILSIDLDGNRANVRVKLAVWFTADKKWFTELNDEIWILEKGVWVFEDHRVVEGIN